MQSGKFSRIEAGISPTASSISHRARRTHAARDSTVRIHHHQLYAAPTVFFAIVPIFAPNFPHLIDGHDFLDLHRKLTGRAMAILLVLALVVVVAIVLVIAVLRWNWLPAFPEVEEIVAAVDGIDVATHWWGQAFVPKQKGATELAFLYVPGALVEYTAYAPLCARVASATQVTTCLISVPMRIAFLGLGRVVAAFQAVGASRWAVGGHSLGGAFSGLLVEKCKQHGNVAGLCLHASFADVIEDVEILQVLASEDKVNTGGPMEGKDVTVATIEGGNHAGFGYYGPQTFPRADGERTISLEEQQSEVVATTVAWLQSL